MIEKRINARTGYATSQYSGGRTGPSAGPAGGASAGGNYGGNRNPQQSYGGNIQSTSGGDRFAKDDPMLSEKTDYVGETIFGPTQKYTGKSSFFGGANKYGYTDQYVNPNKANFGELKPGYGGRIFGGLMSLLTGIPFIGGALGTAYDYGTGIFRNKFYDDMSQYNRLGLYGVDPVLTDNYSDMKISDTSFTPNQTQKVIFDPTVFNQRSKTFDEIVQMTNTLPSNNMIAELTPKQKSYIDSKKFSLENELLSPQQVYETITNPNKGIYDTGIFGIGEQEPTTEEEYNDYLRSLGLTQKI